MKSLFERTSSNWVRYSEYEWKTAEDGNLYLMPTAASQPRRRASIILQEWHLKM